MKLKPVSEAHFNKLRKLPWTHMQTRQENLSRAGKGRLAPGHYLLTDSTELGVIELRKISPNDTLICSMNAGFKSRMEKRLEVSNLESVLKKYSWLPEVHLGFGRSEQMKEVMILDQRFFPHLTFARYWKKHMSNEGLKSLVIELNVTSEELLIFLKEIFELQLDPAIFVYSPEKGLFVP